MTISNRSHDGAFIVHSIFLDYTNWSLAGDIPVVHQDPNLHPTAGPGDATSAPDWQAGSVARQIGSVEYRIIRGQMFDAQRWTARNTLIRMLQLAGAIAGVPGTIESIEFEGGNESAAFWAESGDRKATIRGRYLSSGEVKILEAANLGISDISVIQDGSMDVQLRFQFKLVKPILRSTKLTFQVIDDKGSASTKYTALTVRADEVSFDLPTEPANTEWTKVQVLVNGDVKDTHEIENTP